MTELPSPNISSNGVSDTDISDNSIQPNASVKTEPLEQFQRYIDNNEEEDSDNEDLPPLILKGRFSNLNTVSMSSEFSFAVTTACSLYNYRHFSKDFYCDLPPEPNFLYPYPAEHSEPNRLKFSKYTALSISDTCKEPTGSQIESSNHFIASYWSPRILYKMSGRSLLLVISSQDSASIYGPCLTGPQDAPLEKMFDFAPYLAKLHEDDYFDCPQSLLNITAGAWSGITPGNPSSLIALSHLAGFITIWRVTHFSVEFLAKIKCDKHSSNSHSNFNLLKFSSWNENSCLLAASSSCGNVFIYDFELKDNPESIYSKDKSLEFLGIKTGKVGVGLIATLLEEDDVLISCMEWQIRANGLAWLVLSKPTQLILCEISVSTSPQIQIHPCGYLPIVGLMWAAGGLYLHVIDYEGTYDAFEVIRREDFFGIQSLDNVPAFAIQKDALKAHLSRANDLSAYKEDDDEDDDTAAFSSCNQFLRIRGAVASPNGFQIFIHYTVITGLMDYCIPSTEATFFIAHDLTPFMLSLQSYPQFDLLSFDVPEETALLYHVLLSQLSTIDEYPFLSLETLLWDLLPTQIDISSDSSPAILFVENILNFELYAWSSQNITLAKSLSRVVVYLYHRFRKLYQPNSTEIPLIMQRLNVQSSCSFATLFVYHIGLAKLALDTFSSSNSLFPLVSGDISNQINQIEYNLGQVLTRLLDVLNLFSKENSAQVKNAWDQAINIQKTLKEFDRSPVREVCQVCFEDIPFGNFLHTACTKIHKMTWDRCQLTYHIITSPVNLNCTNCGITLDSNFCSSKNPHSIFSRAFMFHFFTMGLRKIGGSGWRCPHCYGLLF